MLTPTSRRRSARSRPDWVAVCIAAVTWLAGTPSVAAGPPGQIDLAALGFAPAAEALVDLHIGAAQFDLAALATQSSDPELAALLGAVKAFHLKQFSPPDDATLIAAGTLAPALIGSGWVPVKTEFQDTRQVVVYVRPKGQGIAGLVVVAVDAGHEVSIVNVVGNISPTQLATLGLPFPN